MSPTSVHPATELLCCHWYVTGASAFTTLDVTTAAHGGGDVDWADLAARLGYADQSHLIRAFTQLVGHPPATYAREA